MGADFRHEAANPAIGGAQSYAEPPRRRKSRQARSGARRRRQKRRTRESTRTELSFLRTRTSASGVCQVGLGVRRRTGLDPQDALYADLENNALGDVVLELVQISHRALEGLTPDMHGVGDP